MRHLFFSIIVCFVVFSAASAVNADEVPKFDVAPTCRARQSIGTVQNAFAACMQTEGRARDQLKATWAQFTQDDKARCIETCKCGGVTPSYVELLTCLEMANDVRKLHKGGGAASNPLVKEK
jgi:hypothetical protein